MKTKNEKKNNIQTKKVTNLLAQKKQIINSHAQKQNINS